MSHLQTDLCRVRTVTLFVSFNRNRQQWAHILQAAKQECDVIVSAIQQKGYTVQTIRIVSNPFGEYLNLNSLAEAKADLAYLKQLFEQLNDTGLRIRFAIGEARNAAEMAWLPELIATYGDLCNVCVNVGLDEYGILNNDLIEQSAHIVKQIADCTPRGEGNFNFTVNFNCQPFIPYFPAAYHRSDLPNSFVIGLETPDLLVAVLQQIPKTQHNDFFKQCYDALSQALNHHIHEIVAAVQAAPLSGQFQFAGVDSSAAPSKNCASMTQVYELMGVPYFGAAGTMEVSALLTRVFKSVRDVPLVGFSGLMLAVVEDRGLAKGTELNQYDIHSLLANSAVCGIGLDTVPVPHDVSVAQMAALMRDTGTLAFRLNKPLTVRLFPIPNRQAGEWTYFESEDLCNSRILAV